MWTEFILAFTISITILYLPGFLLLKTLRLNSGFSILFAPVASIAIFAILTTVYGYLHIICNVITVLAIPIVLVFAIFVSTQFLLPGQKTLKITCLSKQKVIILFFYIFIGLIICCIFYVKPLDGSSSFYNRYDNITHINLVRAFLESGVWSSFYTSSYLSSSESPLEFTGGFYPSGWHYVVALTTQILQTPITTNINAVNAVFISAIYPSSVFFLLYSLFKNDNLLLVCGSIIALGFTAFPWSFFLKGPLISNFASFCLMPLVLAAFILFVQKRIWKISLFTFLITAFISFVSLALTQTNALFSVFIFVVCFLISYLYKFPYKIPLLQRKKYLITACVIICAIICWIISYKLPFLQSVVSFSWEKDLSLTDALFNLGTLSLSASTPQFLLMTAVLFGFIYLISKKEIWLLVPVLFMAIGYLECRCGSGFVKHFLVGFWYTDPYRLAGNVTIFLTPVAAAGVRLIICILQTITDQALNVLRLNTSRKLIPLVTIILFATINYYPNYLYPKSNQIVQTPFGIIYQQMENIFNTSKEQVYSSDEQRFVNKALSVIPENSIVINQPNDGSVFSYGINSLNTYYRFISINPSNETPESKLIRTSLYNYVTDKEVQQAVQSIGAKYVLLLDQGREWDDMPKLPQSKSSENWIGIDSIDDSTPGFKVVLAEGDMRLYEIEPL